MIINCENCESQFSIDENLIPKEGRVVRCSKCEHLWRVHKESSDEEDQKSTDTTKKDDENSAEELSDETQRDADGQSDENVDVHIPGPPKKAKSKKIKILKTAALSITAILLMILANHNHFNSLNSLYKMLGMAKSIHCNHALGILADRRKEHVPQIWKAGRQEPR